jgi:hypothetical protein
MKSIWAGRVPGDLEDDQARSGDRGREAEPGLKAVAQIAEQERGGHPDHEQADRERGQIPVDERVRRGHHPVGERAAEGEAPAKEDQCRQHGQRRQAEPERRRRRAGARPFLPEVHLEHRRDPEQDDQDVGPVLLRDVPDPAHAVERTPRPR